MLYGPNSTEDRIRELCARAASAEDNEIEEIMCLMRAELREHIANLRKMIALHRRVGSDATRYEESDQDEVA